MSWQCWLTVFVFMAVGSFTGDLIQMNPAVGRYLLSAIAGASIGLVASFGGY